MQVASATDIAILRAYATDSLRFVNREGRFGPFVSIEDDKGVIEVADNSTAALRRVNEIILQAQAK